MLTTGDITNLSNASTYINDTDTLLIEVATELGNIISPESQVYDTLIAVLNGLQADLEKTYNKVIALCDEEYVAY